MLADRYKIEDQQASYFLTITVIYWIDVFSRKEYRDIVVDLLNFCVAEKGLRLNAWVIMSNHLHLVGSVEKTLGMSGFLRDFKKHTSKKIVDAIQKIPESRREWLLDKFSFEARRLVTDATQRMNGVPADRVYRARGVSHLEAGNHIEMTRNYRKVFNRTDAFEIAPR